MLTRTLVMGSILLGLSYGIAPAQEEESVGNIDMADCEAAKEAFDNYSTKLTDPDLDQAKVQATEGLENCTKGYTNQGALQVIHAMHMMRDGTHTPSHSR
jgi:hypothetical protein